ncbi:MAG TPA: HDOD domain-containing protein [Candidatus Krumholzibacteria bacterium]|nr:HDOD domain-containing protein [Candidatus Krumholzibacteria bacterium]HPD70186.1 HDOD domain-containing protein [Candidatus Krumholzibacteria bacterium]HRY40114.1 HDOD domain-containing protein [Candidatus Krumholzibacteria bacterium]
MFKGDIAQFAPADLLLFLCHMNKEGVLTVGSGAEAISLGFRRHLLVDAYCEASDRLILECLERSGTATTDAMACLRQAREETGLPLPRILEDVDWLPAREIGEAVAAGVRETVFRLLLKESGDFQFTEIAVDANRFFTPVDGQALVMDLTGQVDEYRELLRGIGLLDRRPVRAAVPGPAEAAAAEAYVLALAGSPASVEDLLAAAPFPRYDAVRAVATAVDRGWLELASAAPEVAAPAEVPVEPGAFAPYRQALRRLLQAPDPQSRVRELLQFAQAHCLVTVLLVVQGGRLRRATVYHRDPAGRLSARDHREPTVAFADDAVFQHALEHGLPFLGAVFASPVLAALEVDECGTDCALLSLGPLCGCDLMIYAATADRSPATGPLACLELLAWQLRAPRTEAPAAAVDVSVQDAFPSVGADAGGVAGPGRPQTDARHDTPVLDRMLASIKDLPPMPQVVSRILEMLANPECRMTELTTALSHDPALVARLIKVGNSSLYGGGKEIGSLNQAIVRLGMRTTRSVVVAASTRSLFPTDSTRVGLLGRALWQHAVETGLAARRVSEFVRRADPDEAFAGGVLHDLGKLIVLLNLPDESREIQRRLDAGAGDALAVERSVLGFDHTLVGERLLASWGLPGGLRACARHHHDPEAAEASLDLVRAVACGNALSHALGRAGDRTAGAADPALRAATDSLGLDEAARSDLLALLAQDLEQSDLLD